MEGEVSLAYIKKQALVARDKADQASRRAHEIFSRVNSDNALKVIEEMEQKVLERHAKTMGNEVED